MSSAAERMFDSHEERVLRLESEFPLLSSSVAQLEVKVDGAVQGISDVKSALATHTRNSTDNTSQILAKLSVIETEKHKSDALWALVRRLMIPAVIISTALLTKLGDKIYEWIVSG